MHLSIPVALSLLFASTAIADDSQASFLSALAADYSSHPNDYIKFLATGSYPGELTSLALKIKTYTDDSYTTLAKEASSAVAQVESFATNLPWYTRLEKASKSGDSSDKSGSSGKSTTTTSSDSKTTSSSSGAGSANFVAPMGAILGAAALALL